MKLSSKNFRRWFSGSVLVFAIALCLAGAWRWRAQHSTASASVPLSGEAAIKKLKQDGSYESLSAAIAAARYQISKSGERDKQWLAESPAQQFNARFTPEELRISDLVERDQETQSSPSPQWEFGLKLKSFGYGDELIEVTSGEVFANDNRIEILKGAITEWYVNKAEGLEQGFTINERPATVGPTTNPDSRLRLALRVTGDLNAELSPNRQTILLKDRSGRAVLSYDKLAAWDAVGKQLDSAMKTDGREIILEVDDRDALYPVTIDPIIAQQQKLKAADTAANDRFGTSVALDETGDIAVIGASWKSLQRGAVYTFRRLNGIWFQEAKLLAADGTSDDFFGQSVAMSGNTAVIGAPLQDVSGMQNRGAIYVFTRANNGTWSQQQKLTANDGAAGDRFGNSVGISGETLIAGAESDDSNTGQNTGSAYVFVRANNAWTLQQKLTASDPGLGDEFGSAVTISGNTAAIGARSDDISGNSSQGSVYVFTRSGTFWGQQAKLVANDGAATDMFGASAALSGNTLVVGSYGDDIGNNSNQGSAYVFTRSGTTWSQQQKLIAADGAADDAFGVSVDVRGDVAVVGASNDKINGIAQGSAYVFSRAGATWTQQQYLTAGDGVNGDLFGSAVAIRNNTVLGGAHWHGGAAQGAVYVFIVCDDYVQQQKITSQPISQYEYFGASLAVSGNTAVVGAPGWSDSRGAAYVFTRTAANTWLQSQRLTASNGNSNDQFGKSVAIDGDRIVVGAPRDNFSGNSGRGSVYVFNRTGGSWTEEVNFSSFDGEDDDQFGITVAVDGTTVLVGARFDDIGQVTNQGSAYVFIKTVAFWVQQAKLTSVDGSQGDGFGCSVALKGNTALIGAAGDDINGVRDRGSAYIFTRSGANWTQMQKLTASDGATDDYFGEAVAFDSNTALIGASWENHGAIRQGAAYVFSFNGVTWNQQQKLTAPNSQEDDAFGFSVAIQGGLAVVGSVGASAGGAAYLFSNQAGSWTLQKKLTASDAAQAERFGWSVAILDNTALVGAPYDDVSGTQSAGSVYYFTCQECPQMTLSALTNATVGSSFTQTITVTGGGAGAFQFSLADGALPPGLSLSQGGTVSGTPTSAGTYNFTVQAIKGGLCTGYRSYTMSVASNCPTITVNPASLPSGTVGAQYSQSATGSGGVAPYNYLISFGALPNGLTLNQQTGQISGTPTAAGQFNFTVRATDNNSCSGTRAYTVTINGGGGNPTGLQFYPLPYPVRLLDTRAGQQGCDAPGAKIPGQTARTQNAANRMCNGLLIPASAKALAGNITTVQSGGGYLTLYPSDAAQPLVANSNFAPNEILNNVFTVGLGADGAFKIFVTSDTDVVVDVTGYYAPPSVDGLYFHPLPRPIRLLETRSGQPGCTTTQFQIQGGFDQAQMATITCNGVTIPSSARAIVGNATSLNSGGGFLTLYPQGTSRPLVASSNFSAGQIMNAPFTVALGATGEFMIFSTTNTDLVIDVLGYYSDQLNDVNGAGLLFYPLPAPVRLLETRAGQPGCYTPGTPLLAGSIRNQQARGFCGGQTIANTALAIVGNATVVAPANGGYLTFWPNGATQSLVATTNFTAGQIFNRHFTAGLGANGMFNIFAFTQTDLVIDVSGYFAP